MCPGKHPVKIAANYAVSINIYFDNHARRKNKLQQQQHDGDNGDIYLQITDEGFPNNYDNSSNQPNNRINARHELIKARKLTEGQNIHELSSADEMQMQNNLIESNDNHNVKNINRDSDNDVQHFIHIYHWISKQQTEKTQKTTRKFVPREKQINKLKPNFPNVEKNKNKQ